MKEYEIKYKHGDKVYGLEVRNDGTNIRIIKSQIISIITSATKLEYILASTNDMFGSIFECSNVFGSKDEVLIALQEIL
jgi:hypothetical protein